jgi:hypothetical protein
MFGASWGHGEATIVARNTKYSGDGTVATHEFVADVRPADGTMFRATIHEPTIATDFWPPSIGDVVSVLIKSKDGKVKFDKDDERLSMKAYEARAKLAFAAAQNQLPGTGVAPAQPWGVAPSAASPGPVPDAVMAKLAQLGITPGTPMQVVNGGAAQAQAILAAFGMSGSLPPAPGPAPVAEPAEARLERLANLLQQGLLSEDEYATQRQRIISEL